MDEIQLQHTVSEIFRLARTYQADIERLAHADLRRVFDVCRRVQYLRDADSFTGGDEVLKRPAITLAEGGDCDDKTILAGAIFNATRRPWRVATVSYSADRSPQHVYAEVWEGGWRAFDCTYPQNQLGIERPFTDKRIWYEAHMIRNHHNVTTLEGLGFEPVSTTLAVTKIVGALGTLQQAFKSIPVLGGLFKGKTQKLPWAEANKKAEEIGRLSTEIYDAMPDAEGKAFYAQLVRGFFFNHAIPAFGGWWGNWLNNAYNTHRSVFQTDRQVAYEGTKMFAQAILTNHDVTRLDVDFGAWYQRPFGEKVIQPLETYAMQRYGMTSAQLVDAGKSPLTKLTSGASQAFSQVPTWVWPVVGVAAIAFFTTRKRGRRR